MKVQNSPIFNGLEDTVRGIFQSYSSESLKGLEFIPNITEFSKQENDNEGIWTELKDMGVTGYNIPLVNGGYDLGEDVVLMILKHMGIALFNSPYLDTLIASDVLLQCHNDNKTQDKINSILSADLFMGVIGLTEELTSKTIKKSDDEWVINNAAQFISNIDQLDSLLVITNNQVFEVPKDNQGITIQVQGDISGENISKVYFDELSLKTTQKLNKYPLNTKLILSIARLRQASYLLGLAKGSLSEAVNYVNQRKQFGKKLIEFQSISFKLASLLAEIEAAEIKIQHTSWLASKNESILEAATESLAYISEIALMVSRETLHLHGGFGMTKLSNSEKYYRYIALESVRYGTPNSLWLEVGKLRLSSNQKKETSLTY